MKWLILLISLSSQAKKEAGNYTFTYKNDLVVKTSASTESFAFQKAAKVCFDKLTNGKYPGEEKGLQIIDICANPKKTVYEQ